MNQHEKWRNLVRQEHKIIAWILLATALLDLQSAIVGMVCLAAGLWCYKLAKNVSLTTLPIYCHINFIAVGFLLSCGQPLSTEVMGFIAVGVVSTLVFVAIAARISFYLGIPILTFPALLSYLLCSQLNSRPVAWQLLHLEFGKFSTWVVAAVLTLIVSPLSVGAFLAGLAVSACTRYLMFKTSPALELSLFLECSVFVLTSCILSTPSKKSAFWGAFSTILLTASLSYLKSWEAMLLFAHLSVALGVYGSRVFGKTTVQTQKILPEDKLNEQFTQWQRFRTGEPRTGLPFKGTWKVSQSFDGAWTHRGIWQHGLDFIVCDDAGRSFSGEGYELTDYYAFNKEVLAPVSGYVVAMFDEFPDNPVGSVKNQNNFGNYVIIRDAYGAHVLLGHLKQGSVECSLYQYVEANQRIARCGNSGYSPEPHIHMHVQADAVVGHPTIPFHVTNYLVNRKFYFHGLPLRDEVVTSLEVNTSLSRSLGFRIDERIQITSASLPSAVQIINRLDPYWGTMYFTDGHSKLFHYRDALSFYFYRYEGRNFGPLYDLMSALPRVPLIYGIQCQFEDSAPVVRWRSFWQRWIAYLQMIAMEKCDAVHTIFEMNCDTLEVKGRTWSGLNGMSTSCFLDPVDGIVEFSVGDRNYEVMSHRESGDAVVYDQQSVSSKKLQRAV